MVLKKIVTKSKGVKGGIVEKWLETTPKEENAILFLEEMLKEQLRAKLEDPKDVEIAIECVEDVFDTEDGAFKVIK